MITRFDHAVIAVSDFDQAVAACARLGFDVAPGGRHPSFGTRNAIVRFGLDYLELLAIENAAKARAAGPFGAELAGLLARASGLAGFALASAALEDEVQAFEECDIPFEGPVAMERVRPDGRKLAWRLVIPGGSPWRKTWPFLIEWVTPDAERLAGDGTSRHPNGVTGVRGLELVTENLAEAVRVYESALDLLPEEGPVERAALGYAIEDFTLTVTEPTTRGHEHELATLGPGPFRLILTSADLDATAAALSERGVAFTRAAGTLDIAPTEALGARLRVMAPVSGVSPSFRRKSESSRKSGLSRLSPG